MILTMKCGLENRSKLLHDTLAMKDKSVVNSKTKVGETTKKRGRKATSVIFRPTLPRLVVFGQK
ncbi:hypothetical protein H5410_059552 [Solanum commersonii]|uniref:Uncharacterized protein n=1 Tax=Solanum commersonii TaxID=4109 RepID=A0A9J5W2V1_SOLCO|nr:hypothetical protein H5410_059552 [Solanum commersonii]